MKTTPKRELSSDPTPFTQTLTLEVGVPARLAGLGSLRNARARHQFGKHCRFGFAEESPKIHEHINLSSCDSGLSSDGDIRPYDMSTAKRHGTRQNTSDTAKYFFTPLTLNDLDALMIIQAE